MKSYLSEERKTVFSDSLDNMEQLQNAGDLGISFGLSNSSARPTEERISQLLNQLKTQENPTIETKQEIIDAFKSQIGFISKLDESYLDMTASAVSSVKNEADIDIKEEKKQAIRLLSAITRYAISAETPLKEVQNIVIELEDYFKDREVECSLYKQCLVNSIMFSMLFASQHSIVELLHSLGDQDMAIDDVSIDSQVEKAHLEQSIVFGLLNNEDDNFDRHALENVLKHRQDNYLSTVLIKATKAASFIAPTSYTAFMRKHAGLAESALYDKFMRHKEGSSFGDIALCLSENLQLSQGYYGENVNLTLRMMYQAASRGKLFKNDLLYELVNYSDDIFKNILSAVTNQQYKELLQFARNLLTNKNSSSVHDITQEDISAHLDEIYKSACNDFPIYYLYTANAEAKIKQPMISKAIEDDYELIDLISPEKEHAPKVLDSVNLSVATSSYRELMSEYKNAIKLMQNKVGEMLFPVEVIKQSMHELISNSCQSGDIYYSASSTSYHPYHTPIQHHLLGDNSDLADF